jgi:hypothetical protein
MKMQVEDVDRGEMEKAELCCVKGRGFWDVEGETRRTGDLGWAGLGTRNG